ncbi:MAG: hypothetical protein VYE68_03865, partial [Acidobacteriota bacterium]|nr:hypothetical protein [Acidobacteriota bacterium]
FRELLVTVHDLDGRRDLVFALLAEPFRRRFFRRRSVAPGERALEALDLGGRASRHAFDVLAASVSLPVATEPWLGRFATGSGWRGESHRLCDRPEAVGRLLDEVAHAGAEQVILVSALRTSMESQALDASRRDPVGRLGESWTSREETAMRDALAARPGLFQEVFEIRPGHNPLGPFDFRGGYDERSDRVWTVKELIERGYDDGHRQFIGPVLAASGEQIEPVARGGQD